MSYTSHLFHFSSSPILSHVVLTFNSTLHLSFCHHEIANCRLEMYLWTLRITKAVGEDDDALSPFIEWDWLCTATRHVFPTNLLAQLCADVGIKNVDSTSCHTHTHTQIHTKFPFLFFSVSTSVFLSRSCVICCVQAPWLDRLGRCSWKAWQTKRSVGKKLLVE